MNYAIYKSWCDIWLWSVKWWCKRKCDFRILELEADEEYKNFIAEEITKRYNKKLTSDEKWELFDLTTSDELTIIYCTKNGIKFDAYGYIVHDYTNEYKNNPYKAFFK